MFQSTICCPAGECVDLLDDYDFPARTITEAEILFLQQTVFIIYVSIWKLERSSRILSTKKNLIICRKKANSVGEVPTSICEKS